MRKILRQKFIEELRSISPYSMKIVDIVLLKINNRALPEIAKDIAVHCFIEQIEENDAIRLLREYLKSLNQDGYVNFDG